MANMAMTLLEQFTDTLRRLDTSLSFERHPCTAVEFHDEKPREGAAIPADRNWLYGSSSWKRFARQSYSGVLPRSVPTLRGAGLVN